ncbi:Hypothetical predicted protein, partial [Mytilus galloprovincialis]
FLEAVTPVVLGHDVNLFCNASGFDDCCNSHTRRWSRKVNDSETVVLFRGVSSYPEKFTEVMQSGGFSMILKNLNKSDIDVYYTCSYGFYSSKQMLKESYSSNVFLEAVTPVVLGYDVNLFCNASKFDDCCNINTRRWSRIGNGIETVLIDR